MSHGKTAAVESGVLYESRAGSSQTAGRDGPCASAIQQSFGIMVNYLYDHDSIE